MPKTLKHSRAMIQKKRVQHGDIIIGKPLPWDAFDENDKLLLKEGLIIQSEFQLNALLKRGLYIHRTEDHQFSEVEHLNRCPFEAFAETYDRLEIVFCRDKAEKDFSSGIRGIGKILQQYYQQDANASLAELLLCEKRKYPIIHSVHTALICEVTLQALGWPPEERLSTIAAALTMNIAMFQLQERLHSQKEPLSERQRQEIQNHPIRGLDILRGLGVTDQVWLDTVLGHHERLDGSGYPVAMKSDDISVPARVVAMGDLYCAKISSRAYRKPLLSSNALRNLFLETPQNIDGHIVKLLIKKVGMYPPGTFVELNNGEIAVVTQVGAEVQYPVLKSVVGISGTPRPMPIFRDCRMEEFRIKKIIDQSAIGIEVNRYILWEYK